MLEPVIEELKNDNPNVQFLDLDVELNQEKAQKEGVKAVPTLIFKDEDDNEIDRVVGLLPKRDLAKKIKEYS